MRRDKWGQQYDGWAIRHKRNKYIFRSTIKETRREAINAFDKDQYNEKHTYRNSREYYEAVKVRISAVENPQQE